MQQVKTGLVGAALVACLMGMPFAQAQVAVPTDAELKAALRAGGGMALPPDADMRAATQQHMKDYLGVLEKIDKSPAKPSLQVRLPDNADLDSFRSKGDPFAGVPANMAAAMPVKKYPKGASDLLVFVSLSMPPQVLRELARQAKLADAVLVMRGFKEGSIEKTQMATAPINQGIGAQWDINPDVFTTYKVDKVPTFAVIDPSTAKIMENGCAPQSSFAAVSGDISVEAALDTIRLKAQPAISSLAARRLQQYRKNLQ